VLDRFLERGWDVCATTRDAAAEGLPAGVTALEADLTDAGSAERIVAAALDRYGSVEALACVAGGFRMSGPLHESAPEDLRGQLAVNLETAYTITRAALRPMLEAGTGAIVYVGSRAALRPFPGAAPYVISKAAVLALMAAVDVEVRTKGVRVNTVVPNIVDTPRNRDENPDADYARWTTGEELARVIEWLCGDDSAPLSGATIPAYGRS
jgi:NAD(P)-dependent dehydrogenase (short-subunit alcohol dehydrogenase family)